MQKDRHIAIWLRMLATSEIRYARIAKSLLKNQASATAKSFEKEGGSAAEETIRKGQKNWEIVLTALYVQTVAQVSSYTRDVLKGGAKLSMQQLVHNFISKEALKNSNIITGTNIEKVREAIREGFAHGLDERSIGKEINKVLGDNSIADARARTIARTETHNAATYGMQITAEESQLPLLRRWVSIDDDRVRGTKPKDQFNHRDVDKENGAISIHQPFLVSGEMLDRPGDPAGSPGNIINCRCTMIYINDQLNFSGSSSEE